METQSRMRLGREAPVNSFLLCTVLAKQTRRLGRLMPDRGIPELITIALKNCADYELALELGPGVPEVVRDRAMQRRAEPSVASSPGTRKGVGLQMPFQRLRKVRAVVSPHAKHRFLARVRWMLTFLWAALSIFPIFIAIYLAFKGNIR